MPDSPEGRGQMNDRTARWEYFSHGADIGVRGIGPEVAHSKARAFSGFTTSGSQITAVRATAACSKPRRKGSPTAATGYAWIAAAKSTSKDCSRNLPRYAASTASGFTKELTPTLLSRSCDCQAKSKK